MSKTLDDKKSLMFLGGGKSGKVPLIFQTNGSPYRGFLDGRINKKQYQTRRLKTTCFIPRPPGEFIDSWDDIREKICTLPVVSTGARF